MAVKRYILYLFFVNICLSCNIKRKNEIVINTNHVTNDLNDKLWKTDSILLDNGDYEKIHEIKKLYFVDSVYKRIVIGDLKSNQILLFDFNGKYINKIKDSLIQDLTFDYSKNEILILTPFESKIKAFDLDGKFIRSYTLKQIMLAGMSFESLNNTLYFDRSGIVSDTFNSSLTLFDQKSGNFINKYFKIPKYFNYFLYENQKCFDVFEDLIYYIPSFYDTIYTLGKNNSAAPFVKYNITIKNGKWHNFNQKYLSKYNGSEFDAVEKLSYLAKKGLVYNFNNIIVNNHVIYFWFLYNYHKYSIFYKFRSDEVIVLKDRVMKLGHFISKYKDRFVSYKILKNNKGCCLNFYKVL